MIAATTSAEVPDTVLRLLNDHLPYSLPLLRRLQFAKYTGATTPSSRVILVTETNDNGENPDRLVAAYVNFSGGPETQMFLYCSLEREPADDTASDESYKELLQAFLGELEQQSREYDGTLHYPGKIFLGSVNTRTRRVLETFGRIQARATSYYDKWLFRAEDIPQEEFVLPQGMRWDTATPADCEIVVTRTDIPRPAKLLAKLPSVVIRIEDGTPIAWAFISYDGSLISLHCEPPYRRQGLAKAIGRKLLRQRHGGFAEDGWSSADAAADNLGSRGMCKSLKGKPYWETSWVFVKLADSEGRLITE